MTSPDFSPLAEEYARSRPGYPPALFAYLAGLVDRHDVAWDCATGNGQAAVGLAEHFRHVIATDISAEQIRHAIDNPRVDYRVSGSGSSGLDTGAVDLVTVAAAVHWFDLDAFYAEVRRVLQPGGVLAVWTYHVGVVEPPFDRVFDRFYVDVLAQYFAPGAKLVDDRYASLALPGTPLDPEEQFFVQQDWNLHQMKAFISSWSASRSYRRDRGRDPIEVIAEELGSAWGDASTIHRVRWPLFVRAVRL